MDPNLSSALGCSPAFDLGPYTGAVLLGSFFAMALWGASFFHAECPFYSPSSPHRYCDHATVRRSQVPHYSLDTQTRSSVSSSLLGLLVSVASMSSRTDLMTAKVITPATPGV
jgi:hypothetical protein